MWEDYTLGGKGCAIVFSFSNLLDGCDGGQAYWLAPMLYDREAQISMVAQMLRRSRELATSIQIQSNEQDDFWGRVMFQLGWLRIAIQTTTVQS